ncbi:MAG: hypothetical protein ACXVXN_10995, partial [Mycobacteriaceae bacterium]
ADTEIDNHDHDGNVLGDRGDRFGIGVPRWSNVSERADDTAAVITYPCLLKWIGGSCAGLGPSPQRP